MSAFCETRSWTSQAGLGLEIQHDFGKAGFNSFDLPSVIDFRNWAHERAVTLADAQIFSKKSWEAGDCGKWQVLTSQFLFASSECVCVCGSCSGEK